MGDFFQKKNTGACTALPKPQFHFNPEQRGHYKNAIYSVLFRATENVSIAVLAELKGLTPDKARAELNESGYITITSTEDGLTVFNPESKKNVQIFTANELRAKQDGVLDRLEKPHCREQKPTV